MKKQFLILLTLTFSFALLSEAQIQTPAASPTATVSQKIGLTDVEIVYSRPGMKGRKIFGDLVPFGKRWRTGANMATTISFSDDVMINSKEVPAGKYSLFAIPNEGSWTIIVHKVAELAGTGGDSYKEEDNLLKFDVKTQKLTEAVETFTIDIESNEMDNADLFIAWENTKVAFEIKAPIAEKMEKMISSTLDPAGSQYYRAATYYHESGSNLDKANELIGTALEKYQAAGSKPYWVARRQSLIQAEMGNYKEAIKSAEMSLAWAEEAENMDYVKMNKESIAEWKKK